jgi:alpha-amylase
MSRAIVLYLHVHQPYRVRHYTALESGADHNYFETDDHQTSNHYILDKVAAKSYVPTNKRLLELLHKHPEFKLSLSITGTVLEQLERWAPDVLKSFQELVRTGRVEIVAETYHHSLAFFYSRSEFETQVQMHRDAVERLFHVQPTVFRNTELSYNNEVAQWAEGAGYQGILAEGWDPILGWRSPNFAYRPAGTEKIKLLLKNYRLSDDIAFRFGDQNWKEWPMTADKFAHWLNNDPNATNFDLFMDYETFGEHQWEASGIFDFLEALPDDWLKHEGNSFMTVGEACHALEPADTVDVPDTITWADTERDLSAWLGNAMQREAIAALYEMEPDMLGSGNLALIEDWRRLQTSDHFYYMCTKFWNDGDIHAYFSPYDSPFEAYINFMNAYHDLRYRLMETGATV